MISTVRTARCKGIISLSEANEMNVCQQESQQQQQYQQQPPQPHHHHHQQQQQQQPQPHRQQQQQPHHHHHQQSPHPQHCPWTSTLQHVSGYTEEDLVECVTDIHAVLVNEQRVIRVDKSQQAIIRRRQQQQQQLQQQRQQQQQQSVSSYATTPTEVATTTTTTTTTNNNNNKMRQNATTTTATHVNSKVPLPFTSPHNRGKTTRKNLQILEESGLGPAQGQGLGVAQGLGLGLAQGQGLAQGPDDMVPPPTLPPLGENTPTQPYSLQLTPFTLTRWSSYPL